MKISEKDIIEIAELLDCGMICYYHRTNGSIESYPDPESDFFDPEPWQDVIDKVKKDKNNYLDFEKMDSNGAFEMMENFAHSQSDTAFKNQLFDRLSNRKPFQNFQLLVDSSAYREDWFDFKKKRNIDYVKHQLELKD
jgi:Ni,Fe-hydrogenase I large subunit